MSELIHSRIIAVMRDIGPIAKLNQNQQQGYTFRGIDDIYNALHPILVKYGVYCVPEVLDREVQERTTAKGGVLFYTRLNVRFTLVCAEDASSMNGVVVGEAMDSGDKSSNKAMSAAMKYFYFMVFCIPTEGDNDADAVTHSPAPQAQPKPPSKTSSGTASYGPSTGSTVSATPAAQPEQPMNVFDEALKVAQSTPQPAPAATPPAPDTTAFVPPTCPDCGGSMHDKRKYNGAIAFTCEKRQWDRAAKKDVGECSGKIWMKDWLKNQSAAGAPASETLDFPEDSIPF